MAIKVFCFHLQAYRHLKPSGEYLFNVCPIEATLSCVVCLCVKLRCSTESYYETACYYLGWNIFVISFWILIQPFIFKTVDINKPNTFSYDVT